MTVQQSHLSHPKYRADIDGLRAVAVIAVVAFHAFPISVRGGFIGVDVFFVISGYLISIVLFENLDRGMFSFAEFYARRIKRIFPALILVLVSCFIFGWFTLLADEYKQLGKHMAAGAGFISNFILWNEAGYFDNTAETKPLLHLWSLGIEEQYYIVWPFFLWCAWKLQLNLLAATLFLITTSFVLSIWGIKQDMIAAFYSPQTRFWELLTGSLLAWFVLYKKDVLTKKRERLIIWFSRFNHGNEQIIDEANVANFLSSLGFIFLLYGFWEINKELDFPGGWALVPVLGTVLIIAGGSRAWINRAILSNKIAVWFGLISFPLYLWHWPILSFARIIESGVPSHYLRIAAVALSIVLAWITFRYVEYPLRFGKYSNIKTAFLVVLLVIVGLSGYNTYSRDGLAFRSFNKQFILYGESIKVVSRAKECFEIPYAYNTNGNWFCNLGGTDSAVEYFAHGDSHALSLIPALERFAIENKTRIQFTGASGCPSVLGIQSMRGESGIEMYNCKELNERIFDYIKISGIKSVILANRWTYYTGSISRPAEFNPITRNIGLPIDKLSSQKDLFWAIQNTVARYSSIGVKVVFIEDIPQQTYDPKDVLRKGRGVEAEYLKLSVAADEHRENQKLVNEALRNSGAKIINLDDILCSARICPLVVGTKFLYSDDDHLSVAGALFVSPSLSAQLKQL